VAWLAGGCVRDGLLGNLPQDFDIATNASVSEIEKLFEKTVGVGKSFGVMRVIIPGADIEVATFRKDGPYGDGRHPDSVEESTPEEDANRRDFTINALFFDIYSNEVKDYVQGKRDLKLHVIRTVGKAEDRFSEDKLRLMRAVRFVSQLDFDLEEKTLKAVTKLAPQVTTVSVERIRDELEKLFKGKRPDRGLKLLYETELFKAILPEVSYERDWPRIIKKSIGSPRQDFICWLLLFLGTPNENRERLGTRLKLSNEKKTSILEAALNVEKFRSFKELSLPQKKELSASRHASVAIDYLETVGPVPPVVKKFVQAHPTLPAPWITSTHLAQLGIKPGKEMGVLLAKAYESQLAEQVKNREDALKWIGQLVKRVIKDL
jgi:tRNA nucleotidyltransferase (CCA-adding enzyme)